MAKSEVYSWRLSPELKAALERVARRRSKSVSELLQTIVEEWFAKAGAADEPEQEQERIRSAARASFGAVRGGRADRSERARELVRERLRSRRAT